VRLFPVGHDVDSLRVEPLGLGEGAARKRRVAIGLLRFGGVDEPLPGREFPCFFQVCHPWGTVTALKPCWTKRERLLKVDFSLFVIGVVGFVPQVDVAQQ